MSHPLPAYPSSAFVQPLHSPLAITTITREPPSSTTASVPGSSSDIKAIIAGSVIGGFLGCFLVFILVYWLCRRRLNGSRVSRGEVMPAGTVDQTREPESFFGLSCLGLRSKQGQVRRKESKASKNGLVSSPPHRRPSLPFSMNGQTVPKNIPMVHSRSPSSRPPPISSGRGRPSNLWRRGSTDEPNDVRPAPYQYGVVGSRRPSVSTLAPSPGNYPFIGGQGHGEPGWRPDPTSDSLTAALIQYLNQDTPTSPTSPITSYLPSNVGQGSLSSSNPPLTMQPRNQAEPTMQHIPSEFGYGSVSGSAYSGLGSRHSNSGVLNTPPREIRDRHVSLPPPLPSPLRTYPRPWDRRPSYSTHRDRRSRSDEGHAPTSFQVSSRSSRSNLQRSLSTGGDTSGTLVSRGHHPQRVYDQRPRSGGSAMPPPSAFSFSNLGPTDVSSSSTGADDGDDSQARRKGKAVGPTPASRRTSPPASRASAERTPREPQPPSPPDSVLEEIAALARDARIVESRLSMTTGSDRERGRFDSEEGPKVLVLRNG
ncbi:hypothetical protein BS47DRAFT_1385420 [Hydnum rufescens UP504]|uniref:Uncharacterized protein n=1 Tax=Hydnum rufescens UP504 TaxID=1448309 RepID=A0A9P6AJC6_9AGAM|nr:hypothetical protein BS47DRAFT_1385420 [Hydnum rufescens UP504]